MSLTHPKARLVARCGLGAALLFAGTSHLTVQREEFQKLAKHPTHHNA